MCQKEDEIVKELKAVKSVRVYPSVYDRITREFGSFQAAIDLLLTDYFESQEKD